MATPERSAPHNAPATSPSTGDTSVASSATEPPPAPAPVIAQVDLAVSGMTCASCVARVEKRINKIPGATATVNLPLESARVLLTQPVNDADLVAAIERAGYEGAVTSRTDTEEAAESAPTEPATTGTSTTEPDTTRDTHNAPDAHDASDTPAASADTSAPTPDRGAVLRQRLIVSSILTVPVVVLSMVPALQFTGWQWLVTALALPVVSWGAWPFHRAAFRAARHGSSTMDTLVSTGVIAATAWSLWALLFGGAGELGMRMTVALIPSRSHHGMAELYFEVAAVVTTFLLAGRYAEHRSRRQAGDALRSLLEMGAKEARRVVRADGSTVDELVAVNDLTVGDVFVVYPGEKIATDGVVREGASAVDTSLLTGEPVPVDVAPGDAVTGATINTSGSLRVEATRVGKDTTLAAIGRLVTDAQTGKAPIQRLADRISAVFVPIVMVIAVLVFAGWLLWGPSVSAAFTAAVAVLIIACPCALGLATPTALLVGTGRGAQLGILIKGPETLESTRRIDTVVLDKTGTITAGRMSVESVHGPDEVLDYARAVEDGSEHPIARAVVEYANTVRPTEPDVDGVDRSWSTTEFTSVAGGGVIGVVRLPHSGVEMGARVLVGRPAWLADQGVDTNNSELQEIFDAAEQGGATAIAVAWNGVWRGVITLRDQLKETSAQAITEFRELGLTPVLLTGDNRGAALATAREAGIDSDRVYAQVLPQDKVRVVQELQRGGATVAMVGDGVNDAAALATADLGLAMGTGTDVAMQASDITLVRGDLRAAATAIRLSRHTLRIIKQNLFWAFAYNVAAIPLAAAGLLNPMIAGAAMAASSVIVVANSLRLRNSQ
ncbi:heavy metal translocating P-type ATPase [Jonesia quinghaiensis]|uniref:heavy metal translocating P-type ATPase n=1 Tax=Jonesia quinghaiensis TaxID=262806 RepID=UPI000404F3A1|nr:heavy metal translocating P-type ATPase [Jonesia quinghaiensis]